MRLYKSEGGPHFPNIFRIFVGAQVFKRKSSPLLAMPSLAFTESGSWPSSPGDGNWKSSSKLHCHPSQKRKSQIQSINGKVLKKECKLHDTSIILDLFHSFWDLLSLESLQYWKRIGLSGGHILLPGLLQLAEAGNSDSTETRQAQN